jgi:DNA-binding beta-propeller fold protein YncE
MGNNRIQVFDSNGNFLRSFGSSGTGEGQLGGIGGIAIDPEGNVYVSEPDNNRISLFDINGNFITTFGEGQLNFPLGLAIDSEGKIFVVDRNNDRIQVFARS